MIPTFIRRNPKSFIIRLWVYFRRGHSTYFAFLFAMANFIVIQYRLLIQYIPSLKNIFNGLLEFFVAVIIAYVPLAILIGWLDYKRFAVPVDSALIAKANPYSRAIAQALLVISEELPPEKRERIKKILEPWV